jgi:hypothetical protein
MTAAADPYHPWNRGQPPLNVIVVVKVASNDALPISLAAFTKEHGWAWVFGWGHSEPMKASDKLDGWLYPQDALVLIERTTRPASDAQPGSRAGSKAEPPKPAADPKPESRNTDDLATLIRNLLEMSCGPTMTRITTEVIKAMRKHPTWPADPLHAAAIVGEQFGEVHAAAMQMTYEPDRESRQRLEDAALRTAAMAVRYLLAVRMYKVHPVKPYRQFPET